MAKRKTFLERYPFTCPMCNHESYAAPSMFMTCFGMNEGRGECKCGTTVRLTITPDIFGDRMEATLWEKYIETIKIKKEK